MASKHRGEDAMEDVERFCDRRKGVFKELIPEPKKAKKKAKKKKTK